WILRFITKRIGPPGLAVIRALKFDLITASGHNRKQSILICDAKRLQLRHRRVWQRYLRKDHPYELGRNNVKTPGLKERRHPQTDRRKCPPRVRPAIVRRSSTCGCQADRRRVGNLFCAL